MTSKVPPSILKMADTMQVDPFDAELFQKPRALTPSVSKRSRSSSTSTTSTSRRRPSAATTPTTTALQPPSESSSAERKARVFVQSQLDQLRQEEEQRHSGAMDHSIAGGAYVSGVCPTLEVKSIFSDVISGTSTRQAISQSFVACLRLIAIQAYNADADKRRARKLQSGIPLDAAYMQLVQRADLFRTWRLTFFTSLLINISDAAHEQHMREASVDAEPNESIVTLHPLPLQKFLGHMLWAPIPRTSDNLAGKKNCYTCSTPLREGQSSCYKTVRLSRVNRTGVPQHEQHVDGGSSTSSSTCSTTRITPEIVGSSEADKHVHFQICSSCNDSIQMWLGMRDLFRSERNLAITKVQQMAALYAAQKKPLTCTEFVEVYMHERNPSSIWNDVYKCFRMLVNSFGMFLRSACAESTARCMSGLFYDIFPDGDPRNNPHNKPVDPPSHATQTVAQMLSMSVEERLNHLHHLMDPNASDDVGAVWRTLHRDSSQAQ